MKRILYIILVVNLAFSSCAKEEDPYDTFFVGSINNNEEYGVKIGSIEMGSDIRYQSFFDLGTNSVKGFNVKTEWDLGFSNNGADHVILNSAKTNLRVAKYEGTWTDEIDLEMLNFTYDLPNGNLNTMAIGTDFNPIYILNRGYDLEGNEVGYKKIEITVLENGYSVIVADLNGENELNIILEKDADFNYLYLDLIDGEKSIEPEKNEYDILFTHYLHVYDPETEPFPYMVAGVLLNSNAVEVAEIFDIDFADIEISDLSNYEFTNERDVIGFDWKYYDFDEGYITYPEMVFVLKSTEEEFYKLCFTSFYNEDFEKGYPHFEIQKISPV